MNVYVKQILLMSPAFIAGPIVGYVLTRRIAVAHRLVTPNIPVSDFLRQLVAGLLAPIVMQCQFEIWSATAIGSIGARLIALSCTGFIYGLNFFHGEETSAILRFAIYGVLGGLVSATAYGFLADYQLTPILCATMLAAAPLLAFAPGNRGLSGEVGKRTLTPPRKVWR